MLKSNPRSHLTPVIIYNTKEGPTQQLQSQLIYQLLSAILMGCITTMEQQQPLRVPPKLTASQMKYGISKWSEEISNVLERRWYEDRKKRRKECMEIMKSERMYERTKIANIIRKNEELRRRTRFKDEATTRKPPPHEFSNKPKL
jgi:hypothetical protein